VVLIRGIVVIDFSGGLPISGASCWICGQALVSAKYPAGYFWRQ
jgi:hypothetical protein